jgi:hypothetical protein
LIKGTENPVLVYFQDRDTLFKMKTKLIELKKEHVQVIDELAEEKGVE